MSKIISKINPDSPAFRENAEAMESLVSEFGKAIGEFHLIQGKLACMYVTLSTAPSYVYAVADACNRGETTRKDAAGCRREHV